MSKHSSYNLLNLLVKLSECHLMLANLVLAWPSRISQQLSNNCLESKMWVDLYCLNKENNSRRHIT